MSDRMGLRRVCGLAILLALGGVLPGLAQQKASAARTDPGVDAGLARQIAATRTIDNHAHPILPPPGDATDRDFDALPVDEMEPETDIVAWRPDNPQLPAAWKALWKLHRNSPA